MPVRRPLTQDVPQAPLYSWPGEDGGAAATQVALGSMTSNTPEAARKSQTAPALGGTEDPTRIQSTDKPQARLNRPSPSPAGGVPAGGAGEATPSTGITPNPASLAAPGQSTMVQRVPPPAMGGLMGAGSDMMGSGAMPPQTDMLATLLSLLQQMPSR